MKFCLLILCFPALCFASIDVAFLEVRNYFGEVVRLEPEGQYAHTAISFRGYWLHAHPLRGVELVTRSDLEKMGTIMRVAHIEEKKNISFEQVLLFLGKPYDSDYTWGNDRIYCSELVAKLLSIEPKSMSFKSEVWPSSYRGKEGLMGLSPDDLLKIFESKRYKITKTARSCEKLWD